MAKIMLMYRIDLPSVKKLETRLGWKPKTTLQDAIYYTFAVV